MSVFIFFDDTNILEELQRDKEVMIKLQTVANTWESGLRLTEGVLKPSK